MQSHLGSVVLCLASTLRGWVQSSSELLRELWWKCTTSAECKTDISAVLTVKSGLDPHMINKLKDGYKSHSGYFLWPCWVPTVSVLTLTAAQKGKLLRSILKMMLSFRRAQPQSIACEVWSLRFQDKLYNSDSPLVIVFLLFVILLLIIHL